MTTGYFAQITDGIVTDVRRVDYSYLISNPDLYTGVWVEVLDMTSYPAVGWAWDETKGFIEPIEKILI